MITHFKKAALVLALAGCANLNAQKIAHLSFDSLVSMMPETRLATEAAQEYLKGLEQEMTSMQTELEKKYEAYMRDQTTMSDMVRKNKEDDLQQLQGRIQEFQRQAEMDYKRKQAELTTPIMEKAKKGIASVAREGGYKYVLDTSPNNTAVLFSEGDDILMAVKKKLDSMPPASIPGVKAPGAGNSNKEERTGQGTTGGAKTPPSPAGQKNNR